VRDFSLEFVESLGELATFAVIVGLAIEYIPPFLAHFRKQWYERPRLRTALLHVVGPLLVIGGITCELSFHHISTGIQNERDVEQKQTIATITEKAAHLAIEAAELQLKLAEAESRLASIQKQVGARQIDSAIFLKELSGKRKPDKVFITYAKTAADGWYVANQLEAIFKKAEWNFDFGKPALPDNPLLQDAPGIGLHIPSSGIALMLPPRSPDFADIESPFTTLGEAIAKTLGTGGGGPDETLSPGQIRVVIFPRP
jgi:hypothetical protein